MEFYLSSTSVGQCMLESPELEELLKSMGLEAVMGMAIAKIKERKEKNELS